MDLRETFADKQAGDPRMQRLVVQGIELHYLGSGGREQLAGLGIPETESGATGDSDPGGSRRPRVRLTHFNHRILAWAACSCHLSPPE